jgi:hypothetical protein
MARDAEFVARLRMTGFEPLVLDADASDHMYREEVARWSTFIRSKGLSSADR